MARRRNAVRLGVPAAIVGVLALVALWRMGPPPGEPDLVATSGIVPAREATLEGIEIRQLTSATTFWAGKVGEVHPAPGEADMQQRWRVDAATARAVMETGRYLAASEIR
jgi:hypothetical protein